MRRNDERDDETDLQQSAEPRRLHTRNMEKTTYKSDLQKRKVRWKMSEMTARCALCQRCTNCSQHSKTTDFYDRLDRAQPEDQGGYSAFIPNAGSSCNILELLEMPGVGYQNVGRDSGHHEVI